MGIIKTIKGKLNPSEEDLRRTLEREKIKAEIRGARAKNRGETTERTGFGSFSRLKKGELPPMLKL